MQRFGKIHPRSAYRGHDPKFGVVFVRGQGARLWDVDGRDFIDLTCGYSAANFGQAFPPLVGAATRQLQQLTHVTGEAHTSRIELAERIVEVLDYPPHSTKVMFNVSGARAIETAWKAANAYRPGRVVTLGPSYHGRSIATLPLSGQTHVGSLAALQSAVLSFSSIDYPYCGVCSRKLVFPECNLKCVESALAAIEQNARELSAVFVEPAIGARGYIFPPADFFRRLRSLTERLGILLIADEIQTGLGRCGDWTLSQQQGWLPDLLVLGKSLGGGLVPISAVIGRADVLDCIPPGSESESFAASPLATAVGLEVLHQLQHCGWMEKGRQLGKHFRNVSKQALQEVGIASGGIEGQGANCVIECQHPEFARQLAEACFQHRLLIHFSGPNLTRIVLLPALTMSDEERDDASQRLGSAIAQVA